MKQTVFVPMSDEMLENLDPEEFALLVPYAYQVVACKGSDIKHTASSSGQMSASTCTGSG